MNREEFVRGWEIVCTLGEGAFGEVMLLFDRDNRNYVAMKEVEVSSPAIYENIRKELAIHKQLLHDNIIKYYGTRRDDGIQYIFMEFASGGELFDKIEPDVGLPISRAKNYFSQLLSGLKYLHGVGVAHRDIKLENLLLTNGGNVLKICDFGLATIFRYEGRVRLLTSRVGSAPYTAPDVFTGNYSGPAVDLWSAGVVLVAMLAGELPWNHATRKCSRYVSWLECNITTSPWNKFDSNTLGFLRNMLAPDSARRYTMKSVVEHRWLQPGEKKVSALERPVKRQRTSDEVSLSQPNSKSSTEDSDYFAASTLSFSQPTRLEKLLVNSSQVPLAQGNSQALMLQQLIERMTRFYVKASVDDTVYRLQKVADKSGVILTKSPLGVLTFKMSDRRNVPLIFKAWIVYIRKDILVDFRLSKGDGLEFKREFVKIRAEIGDIVLDQPFHGNALYEIEDSDIVV